MAVALTVRLVVARVMVVTRRLAVPCRRAVAVGTVLLLLLLLMPPGLHAARCTVDSGAVGSGNGFISRMLLRGWICV